MWFTRQRRDIFQYWDGTKKRRIDPAIPWKKLWADPDCNVERDFPAADAGDQEAWDRVQSMACRMFDLTAWNEDTPGLTQEEINGVLADYMVFMAALKKKRERLRMQWALSVGVLPETSTTQSGSESSSTQNGSKKGEPQLS